MALQASLEADDAEIPIEPPHEDAHLVPEAANEAAEERVKEQVPVDLVELESMESFPCSDPPGSGAHA